MSDALTVRLCGAISEIAKPAWQALLADDQPFVSWDFLHALEASGSVRSSMGWRPLHLTLYDGDTLVAAAPMYLKGNSHGEFVFDWAWARAYAEHGRNYYPKWLCAVPYSPVTGPRLLARSAEHRKALITAMVSEAERLRLSSIHANFLETDQAALYAHDPWLARFDWQFHWQNRNWRDFQDFLDSFEAKKRKNESQERRKVARAGVRIEALEGSDIDQALWRELHALYVSTFDDKGNTPALTRSFFEIFGVSNPQQIVAFCAYHGGTLIAMALCFKSSTTLYGRYWGAHVEVPGLHFECCYYQGIDYCLRNGLGRFEPGAQGEHKLARGFLPTRVRSAHWIADADFRRAIRHSIAEQSASLRAYGTELQAHSPYRCTPPAAGG